MIARIYNLTRYFQKFMKVLGVRPPWKADIFHYQPGTIFAVDYLDGIMVSPGVRTSPGRFFRDWQYVGRQRNHNIKKLFKAPRTAIDRRCRLDPDKIYFVRDMICVDINLHVIVADNPDFYDWQHYRTSLLATMIGSQPEVDEIARSLKR